MDIKHPRDTRLQIMLTPDEVAVIDDFRFKRRMPTRAAAVRELLKLGLAVQNHKSATPGSRSRDFGVLPGTSKKTSSVRS